MLAQKYTEMAERELWWRKVIGYNDDTVGQSYSTLGHCDETIKHGVGTTANMMAQLGILMAS